MNKNQLEKITSTAQVPLNIDSIPVEFKTTVFKSDEEIRTFTLATACIQACANAIATGLYAKTLDALTKSIVLGSARAFLAPNDNLLTTQFGLKPVALPGKGTRAIRSWIPAEFKDGSMDDQTLLDHLVQWLKDNPNLEAGILNKPEGTRTVTPLTGEYATALESAKSSLGTIFDALPGDKVDSTRVYAQLVQWIQGDRKVRNLPPIKDMSVKTEKDKVSA